MKKRDLLISAAALTVLIVFPAQATEPLERELQLYYSSPTLVQRNEAMVSQLDVDAFLDARVPANQRGAVLQSAERIGQILESLLLIEDFHHLAREAGLLEESIVQARLYAAATRELRSIFQERFRAQTELESYDAQARELFLTQSERFVHPATVSFDHFLIPDEPDGSEAAEMRAILTAYERLRDGASVSELSASMQDDVGSAARADVLERVAPSDLVPQVASTLSISEPGVWSDPVRSRLGWHLVRLTEQHEGEAMSWEEARSVAVGMARERHLTLALERLLRELTEANAVFSEGAIAELRARYGLEGSRMEEDSASGTPAIPEAD
jgi:parvulin-like peptidyl-prolyl isomerase